MPNPYLLAALSAVGSYQKTAGAREQSERERILAYNKLLEQRAYNEGVKEDDRRYQERREDIRLDRVNQENAIKAINESNEGAIKRIARLEDDLITAGETDAGLFGYAKAARKAVNEAQSQGKAFNLDEFGGAGAISDIGQRLAQRRAQQAGAKEARDSATSARADRYATLAQQREERLSTQAAKGYKQYPVVNYGGRKVDVKTFKDSPQYRSAESDWKRHNDIYQEVSGMNDKEKSLYIRGYRWKIDTRPDSETKGAMIPIQDPALSIASDYGTFYTNYKNAQVKFQQMNDAVNEAILNANQPPEDEADDDAFNAGLKLILGDDNE